MSSPPKTQSWGSLGTSPQSKAQDTHCTDEDLRLGEGKGLSQDHHWEALLLKFLKSSWGSLEGWILKPRD